MGQTLDRQLERAAELCYPHTCGTDYCVISGCKAAFVLPTYVWDRPKRDDTVMRTSGVTHIRVGQTAVVSTNNERYEIAQKDGLQVQEVW